MADLAAGLWMGVLMVEGCGWFSDASWTKLKVWLFYCSTMTIANFSRWWCGEFFFFYCGRFTFLFLRQVLKVSLSVKMNVFFSCVTCLSAWNFAIFSAMLNVHLHMCWCAGVGYYSQVGGVIEKDAFKKRKKQNASALYKFMCFLNFVGNLNKNIAFYEHYIVQVLCWRCESINVVTK